MLQQLIEELPKDIEIVEVKQHQLNLKYEHKEYEVDCYKELSRKLKVNETHLIDKFNKQKKKLIKQNEDSELLQFNLHFGYNLHDQVNGEILGQVDQIFYDTAQFDVQLKLPTNKTVAIIFWSVKDFQSRAYLTKLNQMVKDYEDLYIISLCKDKEIEDIQQQIQLHNWDCIHHYRLQQGHNSRILVEINYTSYLVVIDRNKIIIAIDLPSRINFDKVFNQMPQLLQQEEQNLSKEQYKMGKKIMKNKLNSDGFKYINGEFGCKMWRYKYKDGSKRYSKFWIDYSIKKQDQEIIEYFLFEIQNRFDKSQIISERSRVIDYEYNLSYYTNLLTKFGQEHKFDLQFQIDHRYSIVYNKILKTLQKEYHQEMQQSGYFDYNRDINNALQILYVDHQPNYPIPKVLLQGFKQYLSTLDQYVEIQQVLSFNKQIINLEHTIGQIFILIFWGSWCQASIDEMNDNVDLYQSLKEKYNIRVIALSMDKIEDVKSYIYDRSDWIDIFEFYFIEADQQKIMQIYQVRRIPQIIMVDSSGKIHIYDNDEDDDDDLEQFINKRLKIDNQMENICLQKQLDILDEICQQKIELKDFELNLTLNYSELVNLMSQQRSIKKQQTVDCQYSIREDDQEQEQIKELIQKINQLKNLKINSHFIESYSFLNSGSECDYCHKELDQQISQYYDYDHSKYFCFFCGQTQNQNLILLISPLLKKNQQIKKELLQHQLYDFTCYGCQQDIPQPHFKYYALIDGLQQIIYCNNCILVLLQDKFSEESIILRQKLIEDDCLYLRFK